MSRRELSTYRTQLHYKTAQPISLKEFDQLTLRAAYARKQGRVEAAEVLESTAVLYAHLHQERTIPSGMPNWAMRGVTMEYQHTPREALQEAERVRGG